jgi:hypothetical protein
VQDGDTPLSIARSKDNKEVVRLLVAHAAELSSATLRNAAASSATVAAQPLERSASELVRSDMLRSDSMRDADLCCPICLDVYLDPVKLPCGHALDAVCLRHLVDHASHAACPLCRGRIPNPLPAVSEEMRRHVEAKYPQQVDSPLSSSLG